MSKSRGGVYSNIKQLLDSIELEGSEIINQELTENFVVKDYRGEWWYFTGDRIKMLGDDSGEGGGYLCNSFKEGLKLLDEDGYLMA